MLCSFLKAWILINKIFYQSLILQTIFVLIIQMEFVYPIII